MRCNQNEPNKSLHPTPHRPRQLNLIENETLFDCLRFTRGRLSFTFGKNKENTCNIFMVDDEQTIHSLNDEDQLRLHDQRAVVEQHLAPKFQDNYKTSAGKLGLLRAIIEGDVFGADETYEWQCCGIVLGDVFVAELGMEWVFVEDSYGRDPALVVPGTSILLFPLTMISKRIEQGEDLDVFDLFNGIADMVDTKVAEKRN